MKLEGNCSAWKDCMITKIHEMQDENDFIRKAEERNYDEL